MRWTTGAIYGYLRTTLPKTDLTRKWDALAAGGDGLVQALTDHTVVILIVLRCYNSVSVFRVKRL